MNEQNENEAVKKTASKSAKYWKGLSIGLSMAALIWSFSSVLGSAKVAPAAADRRPVDPVVQVTHQKSDCAVGVRRGGCQGPGLYV